MNFNNKGFAKNSTIYIFFVYLASFLIYYLSEFIFFDYDFISYVRIYTNKLTYLLVPIVCGLITLIVYTFSGTKKALLTLIPITLVRLVYYVPYFYLVFIYDNFDSLESLFFAFFLSLGEAAIVYLICIAVFILLKSIIKKRMNDEADFENAITEKTQLDFQNPVSFAFIAVSFLAFLYFFIYEIVNTISFIIQYSFSFTATEIIYTVLSYIFDILLLLIHYFALSYIKNIIIIKRCGDNLQQTNKNI